MDRVSVGDPIFELADLNFFYVTLGEDDPTVVENFMGFSYDLSTRFFDHFLKRYLGTEDEKIISETKEKASLLCCIRMIRKLHKKPELSEKDKQLVGKYVNRLRLLVDKHHSL